MIEIKELRALRGPNRHTRHPAIFMVLNINEYEKSPSNTINGFSDRLIKVIPSLKEHECSIGKPGGFIQRVKTGTWAGHIIEHIAIELQCLAGTQVGYGKTLDTFKKGFYIVVFRYIVESVGLKSAKEAVSIFQAISKEKECKINHIVHNLKILREKEMLGPTTWSIVKEAKLRGIPFIRLNEESHIQLGYGVYQKQIQASMTCSTSAIAVEIADSKKRTKDYLKKAGLPVPNGYKISTQEEAISIFNKINKAVVIKPETGNHGNGATIKITNLDQLKKAFHLAKSYDQNVIIEEYIKGDDFRFLVINNKIVAAAKRIPANIIGDGKYSIKEHIEKINKDPLRGFGHEKILTQIEINKTTIEMLSYKGFSIDYIPKKGEKIYLKATANLSQGGTAIDVTDELNPDICLMMERISKIIKLDCIGIDAVARNISLDPSLSGINIIEVNAAPGFRMHLNPTKGQSRNVAKSMVDMLFQESYIHVPVLAVTGTNGKTTTSKLLAHILKYSGKTVGLACTTGVIIDGKYILKGDYSGPEGARIITREPTVNHIVLEVARGGIIRRGLGLHEVDVGIILNIGEDHLGTDWIESQEDLSLVKSTVVEVVKKKGTTVLNADDNMTMRILDRSRGNIILFSLKENNKKIKTHIKNGGTVILLEKRNIIIRKNELDIFVCKVEEVPITFGGLVDFNISNTLAAIGALYGLKMSIEQIRNGIMTFYSSPTQNPGRMNFFDFKKYKVLLDYGHNVESVHAMAKLLPKLTNGRKLALCHGTGNRTDKQIIEYGRALASVYDYIMLVDFDPRQRPIGATSRLVYDGLISSGFQKKNIEIVLEQNNAIDLIFSKAKKGDLIVIQLDEIEPIMSQIMKKIEKLQISIFEN